MIKLNTKNKIALASLCYKGIHAIRSLTGKSDKVFVRRKEINWHLELNEGIDFSIYILGGFEPGTLSFYSKLLKNKPNVAVFDIGANIGAHTLPLAKIVSPKGGIVYAFEPTKWAFEKLQRNVDANEDLKNGIVIKQIMLVADSSEKPKEEIYSSWPLSGNKEVHQFHRGKLNTTEGAVLYRFDDFIQQNRINMIDFIKVDVDGHEEEVFQGAQHSIEKFFPDIIMEWSPCLTTNSKQADLLSWFFEMDYKVFNGYSGKPINGGLDTLLSMTPESGSINILLSRSWSVE